MKRFIMLGMLFVVFITIITSCVTSDIYELKAPITFENEDVSATLLIAGSKVINLDIQNKTKDVITLVIDLASFTEPQGNNTRLIPEETKFIDATRSQPSVTIPPNGYYSKSFFSADSANYISGKYGGWRINDWLPLDLKGSSFVFGYRVAGKEKYMVFGGDKAEQQIFAQIEKLGSVTINKTYWNILFLNSVEKRRNALYDEALAKAKEQYGEDIALTNVRYQGDWDVKSLLLYFSMLGFVENATISADVVNL